MSYRKLENILTPTGVGAGTYGSNTTSLVATVDAAGRLTGLTARPIALSPDSISNVSTEAAADTLVRRDANGSFSANTVTATLSGRASSAIRLDKPFKLDLIGDVAGSFTTDGSADQTAMVYLASTGVTAGSYGFADTVPAIMVDAKGRVTAATNRPIQILSAAVTDATPTATANTIVRRNASGGFSAGPLTTGPLEVTANGAVSGFINLNRGTSNSVLNGTSIRIDHSLNFFRIYENAAPFRGLIADLSKCASQSAILHDGIFNPRSSAETFAGTATTANTALVANRLSSMRTFSLQGDVIGNAGFDGSADATITATLRDNLTVGGTSHFGLPSGTTAQRPTGIPGMIRYNTTMSGYEAFLPTTGRWHAIDLFQTRIFTASQFDNPNNTTDWPYPTVAPAQSDTISSGMTVRAFDDTAVEGVGLMLHIPSGATAMTVRWITRCATAPSNASATGAQFSIASRQFPPNAAASSWSSVMVATQMFPPTNQWAYASQVVNFTSGGALTAGSLHQFEFVRLSSSSVDTVLGDIFLAQLIFEFS